MSKHKLLITDLHFGVHQNSTLWLNSQLQYFNAQFQQFLSKDVTVYCLGDVFDVRSSINSRVASEVRKLFERMTRACAGVYVIGGNHDYFSPDSDDICNLDLILGSIPGLTLVTHDSLLVGNDALVPWYIQERIGIVELSELYKDFTIFTHTDLVTYPPRGLSTNVFSGHIHQPLIDKRRRIFNLGSTMPLTFADCNSERGCYLIDDSNDVDTLKFISNNLCIRFWRTHSKEEWMSTEWWSQINKNRDYIEIFVSGDDLYDERLQELGSECEHLTIIPKVEGTVYESIEVDQDINEIISGNVPEELKNEFEEVKKKVLGAA